MIKLLKWIASKYNLKLVDENKTVIGDGELTALWVLLHDTCMELSIKTTENTIKYQPMATICFYKKELIMKGDIVNDLINLYSIIRESEKAKGEVE